MKRMLLLTTGLSVLMLIACSKKSAPGKAAKVKTTSYTADVLPLVQLKCTPCHLPSKGGFKANFETYESAKKYAADMVARIQLNPGDRGFMPFKHPKLAEEEISVFKKWVSDGTLEK